MSSLSLSCEDLPNPFTPLAFVPPDVATEIEIARYVLAGTCGAFAWELLSNVSSEYELVIKQRWSFATFVYCLSRICSIVFVFVSAVFKTAPIGHCQSFEKALDTFLPVAACSACFLFFLRIRAVFSGNKSVVGIFFVIWLSVVGGQFTLPFAVTGGTIGPTEYCVDLSVKAYGAAACITTLVHDTLVFVAISLRLLMNSHRDESFMGMLKTFVSRKNLPAISSALLRDGQLYFLITVGSSLLIVIMLFVPGIPVGYRTVFTIPNVFLTNAMACRIYRHTKLDIAKKPNIVMVGTLHRESGTNDSIPLSLPRHSSRSVQGMPEADCEAQGIQISKTMVVEHDFDYKA